MRIGVLTCLWKRRELAALCLDHLVRVRDELREEGDELVVHAVMSPEEADTSRGEIARRYFFPILAENAPLGRKWNAGMRAFADVALPVDGVVIQGSDDFLSADVFRWAASQLALGRLLGGFRDLHYVARGPRAIYWPGYGEGNQPDRAGEPIGCGRFIARELLEVVAWRPWPDDLPRGLDRAAWRRLAPLAGVDRVVVTTMAESGRMLDVKADPDVDMSRFDAYAPQSVPVGWRDVTTSLPWDTKDALTAFLDLRPNGRLFAPCAEPLVSAAMIVRDEEERLERCLASLVGVVDEVVCVDTGSTDRTREFAEALGARVVESPWRDDFSFHRNEALAACRGRWRLTIDGDEWIADRGDLRELLESDGDFDAALLDVTVHGDRSTFQLQQVRVLGPGGSYEFPVHNVPRGYERVAAPTARIETSNRGREGGKCERSLRLLHAMAEDPRWKDHAHAPNYLARTYAALGRWSDAERWAVETIRLAPDAPEYAQAWLLLAQARLVAGGSAAMQAADDVLTAGLARHRDYLDLRLMRLSLDGARAYGAARVPGPYAYLSQSGYTSARALPGLCRSAGLPVTFGRGEAAA